MHIFNVINELASLFLVLFGNVVEFGDIFTVLREDRLQCDVPDDGHLGGHVDHLAGVSQVGPGAFGRRLQWEAGTVCLQHQAVQRDLAGRKMVIRAYLIINMSVQIADAVPVSYRRICMILPTSTY